MSDDLIFTKDDEELRLPTHTNADREPADRRRHKTYDRDHWETAHIERVDNIGAYESAPFGDGPIRSREEIESTSMASGTVGRPCTTSTRTYSARFG